MAIKRPNIKAWIKQHPKWSVFIGLIVLLNYPWFYFGGPIEGFVVDKQTGQPLEGVVAVFSLSVTGPRNIFHGHQSFTLELAEAVTDETGRYEFSWWVSKKRPFKAFFQTGSGIRFYKMGYKIKRIYNLNRSDKKGRFKMATSFKHIESPMVLEKFQSPEAEYKALKERNWYHSLWIGFDDCGWREVPNYMIESLRVGVAMEKYENPEASTSVSDALTQSWFPVWKEKGCSGMKNTFSKYIDLTSTGA